MTKSNKKRLPPVGKKSVASIVVPNIKVPIKKPSKKKK